MPCGNYPSAEVARFSTTAAVGSTVCLVVGNCRVSSVGIPDCPLASTATVDHSTIVAGPQTGTCKAMWSASGQSIVARTAAARLQTPIQQARRNYSVVIPRQLTTVSGMQDREKPAIVTSSEFRATLTSTSVWERAFRCRGVKGKSFKSALRHSTSRTLNDLVNTTLAAVDSA